MFKSVATKLAHNTTVPSLGGNKDLRSLQDLITAEKQVLASSQKFALDLAKSAEALKHWGAGEGDDLGDVSTAATTLMLHLAGAINHFSSLESTIREQMKSVRSREEALDEMRRRRRQLASRADDAERRLSKMKAGNKDLQSATATLSQLRDDIRLLDADIMNEEAGISDFKRHSMKSWLGHKFGGIQDFCEKGLIVSDLGKQLLNVIPLEPTQPGLPRQYYMGHAQTETIVAEAQRAIQDVTFSIEPGTGRRADGGSIPIVAPQPTSGGFPIQPEPTGQSFSPAVQQNRLSGQFSPATANTFSSGFNSITAGDKPGETIMRADSVSYSSPYQSVPPTPQSQYAPPQGPPPPGQGYGSPTVIQGYGSPVQQSTNYSTRASFIGLPQIQPQGAGSDLGMTSYLSPTHQDSALPSVPEQQQQQIQSSQQSQYPQQLHGYLQQPQQSPYNQSQHPYQHQQFPQQAQYPEPQMYPPSQPDQQQQQQMPQGSGYASYTYPQVSGTQPEGEVNEFGTYSTPSGVYAARSSSLRHARQGADLNQSPADPTSGRFATFPVKAAGPRPTGEVPIAPTAGAGEVPQSPVMEERVPSLEVERPVDSFSSSVAEALGQQWQDRQGSLAGAPERQEFPHHAAEPSQAATSGHAPPDGAATVSGPPSYDDAVPSALEHQQVASDGDVALAYMSEPEGAEGAGSESSHGDKMVRFGSVRDVDKEMAKRHSHPHTTDNPHSEVPNADADANGTSEQVPHGVSAVPTEVPASGASSPPLLTPHRAPTPSEHDHGDEGALNAAAAREVSRELDQLMFSSQTHVQPASEVRPYSPPQPPPPPQANYQMYRAQSPPTSPTASSREPQYIREKDRAGGGYPSRQPTPISPQDLHDGGQSPLIPPAAIGLTTTGSTASFRTPPEYPTPTSPGSLYGLGPSSAGSATSFIPGANPRTISAAAFKRQVRQPTNPASTSVDGAISDTSPLLVKKRLPASPHPVGARPQDGQVDMQRMSSSPTPVHLQEPGTDSQYRSVSAGYAMSPQQQQYQYQRDSFYGQPGASHQGPQDLESYDYLSAYMSDSGHKDEGAPGRS